MTRATILLALGLVTACTWEQPEPAVDTAEVELAAAAPAGIDCLHVTLAADDGTTRSLTAALLPNGVVRFPTVRLGAYEVTGEAYAAGDCSVVPASPPWITLAPAPLVVLRGRTNAVTLELVRVRQVVVSAAFHDNQIAVAADQGEVGAIAAATNRVAWVAGADVAAFVDTDRADDGPVAAGGGAFGPVAVAPDGRVAWTAADGVRRFTPGAGAETLAGTDGATGLAVSADGDTLYFDDLVRVRAVAAGAVTPIADEAGAGTLAIGGDDALVWVRGDGAIRRVPPGGQVATVATLAGGDAIVALAADADAAYVATRAPDGTGAVVRAAGGSAHTIWPRAAAPTALAAFGGSVYVASPEGLFRTSADGTGPVERLDDGDVRGVAVATWGGHAWIYFTDARYGGVVWRALLA
jgi:hypothetical protein